jgi:hypothetical protein
MHNLYRHMPSVCSRRFLADERFLTLVVDCNTQPAGSHHHPVGRPHGAARPQWQSGGARQHAGHAAVERLIARQ